MAERWLRNERLRERLSRKSSDRFCGLEIDRKTNVISLVAFVLSAASVAGQIYFFLQGPVVALQPPEQIVFFGDRAVDGKTYLKLAARMAYVNTGQPGFNDAIKREQADLRIGSRTLTFYWKKYLASDADGTIFRANPKGDALPVAVNAGGVEAHETAFSPLPATAVGKDYGANFIEFSKFQQLALEEKQLIVTLTYETFGGTKGKAACKVIIDQAFQVYIANGWIAPLCAV